MNYCSHCYRYQCSDDPHSRLRAILDPLEKEWHFIEVRARGRKSEVALTEQGRAALRIFGSGDIRTGQNTLV